MITKKGVVVKISGDKTAKVQVNEYKAHPKYKKQYRVTKNFLVHDEDNTLKIDDKVIIKPCRPLSKTKSWEIDSLITNK